MRSVAQRPEQSSRLTQSARPRYARRERSDSSAYRKNSAATGFETYKGAQETFTSNKRQRPVVGCNDLLCALFYNLL